MKRIFIIFARIGLEPFLHNTPKQHAGYIIMVAASMLFLYGAERGKPLAVSFAVLTGIVGFIMTGDATKGMQQ